jgi:hypothetical protein
MASIATDTRRVSSDRKQRCALYRKLDQVRGGALMQPVFFPKCLINAYRTFETWASALVRLPGYWAEPSIAHSIESTRESPDQWWWICGMRGTFVEPSA